MNEKMLSMKYGSSRYWAWEFLRRNHVYRDAYSLASKLTDLQQSQLQTTSHRILTIEDIDPTLPFRAFVDRFELEDWKPEHQDPEVMTDLGMDGSVGDARLALVPLASKRPIISLDERYNRESYGLAKWVEPSILASELDENIFEQSVPTWCGLTKCEAPEEQAPEVIYWDSSPWSAHGPQRHETFQYPTRLPSLRRVYHGKPQLRPSLTPFGFAGKNGQHFAVQQSSTVSLEATDILVKISVAHPLKPQLDLLKVRVLEYFQQLESAGITEPLAAAGHGEKYEYYLQLLDGIDQGMAGGELAASVKLAAFNKKTGGYDAEGFRWEKSPAARDRLRKMISRARALRDYDFLNLAFASSS